MGKSRSGFPVCFSPSLLLSLPQILT